MKNTLISTSLVLLSFLTSATAHPVHHHHRRYLKVVTVTQEVVKIDYITSTIYVDEPISTSMSGVALTTNTIKPVSPAIPIAMSSVTPTVTPPLAPISTSIAISISMSSKIVPSISAAVVFVTTSTPSAIAPASLQDPVTSMHVATSSTTPIQIFAAPTPTITETQDVVISSASPTAIDVIPASTTPAVNAAPTSSGVTSSGTATELFSGDGTFYAPGLGSCGVTSSSTDMIAALSFLTMDLTNPGDPNNNPMCGRKVRAFSATNTEGIIVSIIDTCAGCMGSHDLDFSPSAFDLLGLEATGRIPITWEFV